MLTDIQANKLEVIEEIRQLDNASFEVKNNLWIKQSTHHQKKIKNFTDKKYSFVKMGRTFGFQAQRYLSYNSGHFFYYQNIDSNALKGYCKLQNIYLSFYEVKNKRWLLHLTNGTQSSQLFFTHNDFKQIKENLFPKIIKFVIQLNFEKNYKIIQTIGHGGFSKVYLVQQKKTGLNYAAKIVFKKDKHKASTKTIVEEQKRILSALNSPFICNFKEFFEEEDLFIFILEYIPGKDLMNLFKEKKIFSLLQLKNIFRQILQSLLHCHQNGIIHRDLKPQNIIVNLDAYQTKLIDFGLSLFNRENLDNKVFKRCGTVGYMAPEVIINTLESKKPYNEKCDLFSLGIIVHMMLLGLNPLKGKNYQQTFLNNKKCKIDLNKEYISQHYGIDCYHFLKKLLQVNPQKRYNTQQALASTFLTIKQDKHTEIATNHQDIYDTNMQMSRFSISSNGVNIPQITTIIIKKSPL